MVAAALPRPQELPLPFGCWSRDRLPAYLHEHQPIALTRSRVGEILLEAGRRWRKEATWVGTGRVDPDFAPKKGGPRAALPRAAARERGALPRREGARVGPKLPGGFPPAAPRPRHEVDYGRRGKGSMFGAFDPGEGRAFTLPYPGRTPANGVDFLPAVDQGVGPKPPTVFAIVDNLSTHRAADVLLFSLANPRGHFVFQPP